METSTQFILELASKPEQMNHVLKAPVSVHWLEEEPVTMSSETDICTGAIQSKVSWMPSLISEPFHTLKCTKLIRQGCKQSAGGIFSKFTLPGTGAQKTIVGGSEPI